MPRIGKVQPEKPVKGRARAPQEPTERQTPTQPIPDTSAEEHSAEGQRDAVPGFTQTLARIRAERGWNMVDLARALDLSYPYVVKLCHGQRYPSLRLSLLIAQRLGLSVEALAGVNPDSASPIDPVAQLSQAERRALAIRAIRRALTQLEDASDTHEGSDPSGNGEGRAKPTAQGKAKGKR